MSTNNIERFKEAPNLSDDELRELGRPHVMAWLHLREVTTLRQGDAADLMERVGAAIEAERHARYSDHAAVVKELETRIAELAQPDQVAEDVFKSWQERLWAISGKVRASPDLGMESAIQFVERRVSDLLRRPSLPDAIKEIERMRDEWDSEAKKAGRAFSDKANTAQIVVDRLRSLSPSVAEDKQEEHSLASISGLLENHPLRDEYEKALALSPGVAPAPSLDDAIAKVRELQRDWENESRAHDFDVVAWPNYVDAARHVITALESLRAAASKGEGKASKECTGADL